VDATDAHVADATDSGAADTGSVDSGAADTGSGFTPPPCDFSTTTDCLDPAPTMGTVNGDDNSQTVTASSYGSEYLQAYVSDSNCWSTSDKESYTVTLTVPAGTSYNLFVYEGTSSGIGCSSAKQGTVSGNTVTVSDSWNDAIGSDDSKYLVIYVQYVSGTQCDTAHNWTVKVAGNTLNNTCCSAICL
jgi:hypothetical protein